MIASAKNWPRQSYATKIGRKIGRTIGRTIGRNIGRTIGRKIGHIFSWCRGWGDAGGSGGGGGPGAAASQGQGVGPLGKGGPGGAFQNKARLGRGSLPNTHTVYNWFQSTHTVYGWFSIHSYGLYLACTPPQIDNLSEILTSWSHWLGCYTFWLSVVLEIGLMILPPPYCFAVMGRLGAILRVCRGPNQNGNSKVKIVDPCFLGPPVCDRCEAAGCGDEGTRH